MLYPFMTMDDGTEIVHSESYIEDGMEKVRVEIEKPVTGGFSSAECILPEYTWKNIHGFDEGDILRFQELRESVSHIIIRLRREGGFDNASGFLNRGLYCSLFAQ